MKNKIFNSRLWISYVIHSLIPLLPLLVKGIIGSIIDGGINIDVPTLSISVAMYTIGTGISSENFLLFIVYFFVACLLLPVYGAIESSSSGASNTNTLIFTIACWLILVVAMITSFFESYKSYVIECRPLEVKFAQNLIDLTSNLSKTNNS